MVRLRYGSFQNRDPNARKTSRHKTQPEVGLERGRPNRVLPQRRVATSLKWPEGRMSRVPGSESKASCFIPLFSSHFVLVPASSPFIFVQSLPEHCLPTVSINSTYRCGTHPLLDEDAANVSPSGQHAVAELNRTRPSRFSTALFLYGASLDVVLTAHWTGAQFPRFLNNLDPLSCLIHAALSRQGSEKWGNVKCARWNEDDRLRGRTSALRMNLPSQTSDTDFKTERGLSTASVAISDQHTGSPVVYRFREKKSSE
ncbi:unnamed protein product [Darwinula stevensoni]|uniref:Uncharacterized protein n=1 Tax=Darwinula stevensoni TaxID=69355 RepID=A0A7R8X242_9CRUS|nr:unnamed protein product [Darwinula stevensoni]CAG0883476.1 unnamed protein product [Darwinula stevensoni]